MIKRYAIKAISELFSLENKYRIWKQIEILNCEALYLEGLINESEIKIIRQSTYDFEEIINLEAKTKHDVIAFTRALSLKMPEKAKKWIHYGLTSSDLVDTTNAYLLKKASHILLKELRLLIRETKKLALEHQATLMVGRTHGVHAEVITFGWKLLGWYAELERHYRRIKEALEEIAYVKISGALGTFAHLSMATEKYLAQKLDLKIPAYTTQILARDHHAHYFAALNNLALSINKFSTELRHLSLEEIGEVKEYFWATQKGSSAMPHKRNPITLENICGLSRMMAAYQLVAQENLNLWNERDISHSSNERIIFLDGLTIIVNITAKFRQVLKTLEVDAKKMLSNLELSQGAIFSQKLLLTLIKLSAYSREFLYDQIQLMIFKAKKENLSLQEVFLASQLAKLVKPKQLDAIFNYQEYLKNLPQIYERVFKNASTL